MSSPCKRYLYVYIYNSIIWLRDTKDNLEVPGLGFWSRLLFKNREYKEFRFRYAGNVNENGILIRIIYKSSDCILVWIALQAYCAHQMQWFDIQCQITRLFYFDWYPGDLRIYFLTLKAIWSCRIEISNSGKYTHQLLYY